MKKHLTIGLLLGAISMGLGTFAGIKTLGSTKTSGAQAVTYYELNSNIHASYSTSTHYLWSKSGSVPNYNPETNTGVLMLVIVTALKDIATLMSSVILMNIQMPPHHMLKLVQKPNKILMPMHSMHLCTLNIQLLREPLFMMNKFL